MNNCDSGQSVEQNSEGQFLVGHSYKKFYIGVAGQFTGYFLAKTFPHRDNLFLAESISYQTIFRRTIHCDISAGMELLTEQSTRTFSEGLSYEGIVQLQRAIIRRWSDEISGHHKKSMHSIREIKIYYKIYHTST